MGYFAVIDTETNWADEVMSIGTVIAERDGFRPVAGKYHILLRECEIGGMFESTLYLDTPVAPILCQREEAIRDLTGWFREWGIREIFAYNAGFDKKHLPELSAYSWHDIMALAAYRQYNPKISPYADCCSTGRLKRGYGVEDMLRMLTGNYSYHETHNAYFDAREELEILRLLGHPLEKYKAI